MTLKIEPTLCPKCGGQIIGNKGEYHCKECKREFTDGDILNELDRAYSNYQNEKEAQKGCN